MGEPVLFGSYELLDRIAEGGMAEVWRARSRGVAGFEKTVVIKRVLPSLMAKPGFADLLIREAKIAARLSHPRIVQIFDLGEENGSYFIAMEYVSGRDLGQAMSHRGGPQGEGLSLPLRVWIVAEVAGALDHAHRRRGDEGRPLAIVHRDVSPQNILLGYEGEVKVADFGIARADEAGLGRGEDPKILRGKYAYMSPEQARGEPLDRRSDVFSLGIVLYELLVGKRMFRGRSSQETLAMVRAAQVPELDAAKLGVDDALARVLARCLAPQRDDRYAYASELYADLTQWLFRRGEPVGQPMLAAAMERMFPPEDAMSPNKLRVDVLMRAYQDATSISLAGASLAAPVAEASTDEAGGQRTAAMPSSRRVKVERRRVALLAVEERDGEIDAFAAACDAAGGSVLGTQHGMRLALFGLAAGVERGEVHAVRAALELRRALRAEGGVEPVPGMTVIDGEARVVEGVTTDPEPELIERARALLDGAIGGEIRVEPELVEELSHHFRMDERPIVPGAGRIPIVEGYRARAERNASALRRRAPLVGRRDELRRLSEAIVEVAAGAHRVVHLVGEPGAGKSRLLAEMRALVTPRDVHVVTGRADEAGADRPFAALAELVGDLCGVEPDDTPSERFAKVERIRVLGLSPREARLCGELLGLAYPVAPIERPGRPRSLEIVVAIRKAIDALAHERTVLVVLEDLQWLDDSTRQVLPLLMRGLSRARVMVVLTRRPGALVPHLPGMIVRLAPLPPDAAGRLFAASLGARAIEPELLDAITRETGGNPEWIELLASDARDAASVAVDAGIVSAVAPLPTTVSNAARNRIGARLGQLRPIDRAMLTTAAMIEPPIPVDLLCAVEGLVGHTGVPALRRLLARRLLVASEHGASEHEPTGRWGGDDGAGARPERVSFPGAMIARAVRDALDAQEQRRLHARVVATLERIGAASTPEGMRRLAFHAARSFDRRRAPEYLEEVAAHAESRGAPGEAADALAEAARVLREEGDDREGDRAVELTLRASRLAIQGGQVERARALLDELASSHGAHGRPATRIAIALARAEAAMRVDHAADALAALEEIDPALVQAPVASRASVRLAAGRALIELGRTDDAIATLVEAVAAFREANDGAGRGHALAVLALAEARADRARAADDTAEEALAVAARLGHADLRYAALAAMGAAEEAAGDLRGAAARTREALEVATHAALEAELPVASLRAALASLRAGEGVEAAQRAEQAIRLARKRRLERIVLLGSAVQATIAVQEHPDASFVPAIVRAIDRLEALGRTGDAALAVELLALAHRALGDEGAASRARTRGADLARRAGWLSLAHTLERASSS
ncbi:serine/threonine-protein kinase PknK [Sandaracinus amylolyticus]|uniref:Serine/threonine protein kinase PrkC, regulator of stationary phase n=1 Tax=Sandaracinus amylolyticus TaxID=927083 RepID=A0A0F6W4F5_9BACT|nr:serine/threonine-protein kinase [Sandaracinus amylolyticus]AKF07033.1 Serine/threonine protein kinase PrkC, regulator of stationary phase [Sandaracinus amylolyticus]